MKTLYWVLKEFSVIILFACIFYVAMNLFYIKQDTTAALTDIKYMKEYCFD